MKAASRPSLSQTARSTKTSVHSQPEDFASDVGLKYVHDNEPGLSRMKRGKRFVYLHPDGKTVSEKSILTRIASLVIPPAWQQVWICRTANGHLQVTGRDARGRKQYRYHAAWTTGRNENKFHSLKTLAKHLPQLRSTVERDLRKNGLPKEKVVAAVVKLLELTQIRVGNDEYAAQNESFGLTTILNRHARVSGSKVAFRFKGKSGVLHDVLIQDARLSRIVSKCQHLPGQELFAYVDDQGVAHDIGSADVNRYLKEATGGEFTAKDLRTWSGSVKALEVLTQMGPCLEETVRARRARELAVIRETARHLRNTVAVCRKYYVHPRVFEADRHGHLPALRRMKKSAGRPTRNQRVHGACRTTSLSAEERALAILLS